MLTLYHAIPRNMSGTVLYPLNALKDVDSSLYEAHAAKYEGREHLMEERIPLLDCRWNDVLFLTAVSPVRFRAAYESTGYVRERPFRAYAIDVATLDQSRLAALTEMELNKPVRYEPFDPARYRDYATIPEATLDYWRAQRACGEERP
ncbi:MAG TPA: hypothetical protein VEA36_00985, partial [Candidatus Paceibacterota bacterium]|nr:hypothetical protein [Candidatus Paceibacterota bacterium]